MNILIYVINIYKKFCYQFFFSKYHEYFNSCNQLFNIKSCIYQYLILVFVRNIEDNKTRTWNTRTNCEHLWFMKTQLNICTRVNLFHVTYASKKFITQYVSKTLHFLLTPWLITRKITFVNFTVEFSTSLTSDY